MQLPSGVTSIGYSAFKGCRSLPSIALPESLTSIGCDAFNGCASLTAIKLPSSLSRVGRTAFSLCSKLTSIELHVSSISTIRTTPTHFGSALEQASFFPAKLRRILDNHTTNKEPDTTTYRDWKAQARTKNRHNHRYPLHTAAARSIRWSEWLQKILCANLAAIEVTDGVSGLEPFMPAAAGSNNCLEATYNLLRENPAAACFRHTGRGESGSSAAATRKGQCARKRERGVAV